MEACKRQISSRPFQRTKRHQNRPNINEMAAFQSLATERPRCGFFKGSLGTHKHKDTQLQSQTLSHTHSTTHPPALPPTHSLTSTLFLCMMEGGFGPMEACKRQISSRPFQRTKSHQNQPNINEMAAFQSLATERPRCGFFKGSIGTHKHKDTQLRRV